MRSAECKVYRATGVWSAECKVSGDRVRSVECNVQVSGKVQSLKCGV